VGDAVMAIVVPKGSHGAYREQIVPGCPIGRARPCRKDLS
jgi:hypothetical protein